MGPPATAIEALAESIQRLPPGRRWLHASEAVVLAQATRGTPRIGPRTRIATVIIVTADRVGLAGALIACANLALLLGVYLGQFRTRVAGDPQRLLFVGLRAMREPELIAHFRAEFGFEPTVVDETDLGTFRAVRRLGFDDLLAELLMVREESASAMDRSRAADGVGRRAALVALMLGMHRYAYFRAWFRKHAAVEQGMPVGFAAASSVAAAAVAVGIHAIYLPHGFIARTVVFPDFAEAWCFNRPEAGHLVKRLPQARVRLVPADVEPVVSRRIATIAGVYGDAADFDLCRSFIAWAQARELPVVIRAHPRDTSGYWNRWRGVPGVTVATASGTIADFLQTQRPMFLATWHSTTLFDALVHGVMPITLSEDGAFADNFVFPFREAALRWPQERTLVETMLVDPRARGALLRERRDALLGDRPGEGQGAPVRRAG